MKKAIQWSFFVFLLGAITPAFSQLAWTPEQKAVWKTETTMDSLQSKGDFQAAWSYIDDSYQGWRNDFAVPRSKTARIDLTKYGISQGGKVDFYEAAPIVIWVNGNYAYADYYYNLILENKAGEVTHHHGRWMDVLMKKDGKWLLVGDHGGEDPSPKK